MSNVKKYGLAVIGIVLVLFVIGIVMAQINVIGPGVQQLAAMWQGKDGHLDPALAPAWLVFMENNAPVIAYITWVLIALGILYIAFFMPGSLRRRLVESTKTIDVILGLVVGSFLAGLTGWLWAYFNPVPILPPYVHLRIFAFLIGVWAIVVGRGTGFITGYFASLVWARLSGAWVLFHSPIADGIFVGLMTGWFISVMVRQGRSREELIAYIDEHRWRYYFRCAWVSLIGGLVMAFFVAPSLSMTTPFSWFAGFWGIGVLSDTPAMVIWTGPVSEIFLRLTRKITWLPNF